MSSELNVSSEFTARVPHGRSPSLSSRDDRWRPSLWVRLRVFMQFVELDEALAEGTDPGESDELLLRAQQLATRRKRIGFARAIEKLVDDAGSGRPRGLLAVFKLDPLRENRSLLLELARRLRADVPHALRGLAMVEVLLYHGDSPLYGARTALELKRTVTAVLSALGGEDPSSTRRSTAAHAPSGTRPMRGLGVDVAMERNAHDHN